ncbi:thaumatin-like protein [Favolaschia claudopus]|uniref:Thaumatin-like protein n=1 Tax=Favolaschia claudopus TaxID=2862362 RepID=A0AAW0A5G4_9AGAR
MTMLPRDSTLFLLYLSLVALVCARDIHGRYPGSPHHELAGRIGSRIAPSLEKHNPRRLNRRRSCTAPNNSFTSSTLARTTEGPTNTDTPIAKTTKTGAKTATKATPTSDGAQPTGTVASSTGSHGGHSFTLINKCSSAVKPVVASTACGYSPRCADASTAALPSLGSLGAGKTTSMIIPNNFVGRIFAQDGSCGTKGESCTMLELNLDADSFYTPNSYDISNIQGFTQSISLGADGCSTVTCTSPSCSCNDAYPIGDMTGCGNDLPVKACGKGNKSFTVVFCP